MDELRELITVVSKNKIKDIRTLDTKNKADRVNDFYNRILGGELKNDAEASDYYFKKEPSYPQYRKLKAKLKHRLYDSVFFVDINHSKFSDIQKAFYQCHKNWIATKILIGRGARNAATSLAKHTLKYTRKYEFTEISLDLYRTIRYNIALRSGNEKEYQICVQEIQHLEKVFAAENDVAGCFDDLLFYLKKSINPDQKIFAKANQQLKTLSQIPDPIKSARFKTILYFFAVRLTSSEKNFYKLIQVCDEAIHELGKLKNIPPQLEHFYYYKLLGLIETRQYQLSTQVADHCLQIIEPGTVRWFNIMEIYFLFLMHIQKYQEALLLLKKAIRSPMFEFQSALRKETFKNYQAYLFLLYKLNKIEVRNDIISSFRIRKFLNEIPIFSMDKRGYNIPVLIMQIVLLIQGKKYDQLTDRMEAIEKYTTRYLKKDANFRSNCFIKMLLQIPKRGFHKIGVSRHAKKYYDKLKSVPLSIANQAYEVEIIPYEHLWEYVLESLDSKFH